jgi:hypothetical protein
MAGSAGMDGAQMVRFISCLRCARLSIFIYYEGASQPVPMSNGVDHPGALHPQALAQPHVQRSASQPVGGASGDPAGAARPVRVCVRLCFVFGSTTFTRPMYISVVCADC